MQHVRIGYQDPWRVISNFFTFRLRCVTIVNSGIYPYLSGQSQERIELIPFQRFKRKQHESMGIWVSYKAVNYGDLITKGLATGCAGGKRHVLAH